MNWISACVRGVAVVVLTGVVAWGGENAADQPEQPAPAVARHRERPLRFVCVSFCMGEPFFTPVEQGAKDAAALMDVELDFIGTQGVDVAAQVQMVCDALADNCDGIALVVSDATAFDSVLRQANTRGIPVVAFNLNAQPKSRVATVAQNLYDAGRSAAYAAAPQIPDGSRILMTVHSGAAQPIDDRYRGIRDELKNKDIVWMPMIADGGPDEVARDTREKLLADPSIKVVFATCLPHTEAIGKMIERDFKGKNYVVVGFDVSDEVCRLIKAGAVQIAVDQQPYMQGFYPVVQLTLAKRYGIEPANMDAGSKIIRSQNVDASLRQRNKGRNAAVPPAAR